MPQGISSELRSKFKHKLDPKNRLAIPAEWEPGEGCPLFLLEAKKEGLMMVKVLTLDKFREYVDMIRNSDKTPATKESMIGRLYAECVETTINAQGKMLIPKKMCELADLSGDVRLVGRGSFFELWKPDVYDEFEIREKARLEDVNADFGIF